MCAGQVFASGRRPGGRPGPSPSRRPTAASNTRPVQNASSLTIGTPLAAANRSEVDSFPLSSNLEINFGGVHQDEQCDDERWRRAGRRKAKDYTR